MGILISSIVNLDIVSFSPFKCNGGKGLLEMSSICMEMVAVSENKLIYLCKDEGA